MTKFEKVSYEQFEKDWLDIFIDTPEFAAHKYVNIKLPKRATKSSAGYDFYSPKDFILNSGETILIPTGIKIKLPSNKFLAIAPRSGLGFKYRLQLDNTIGIIDADYYNCEKNEGHIMIKITNDSKDCKLLEIKQGEAFAQGIILNYGLTDDDVSKEERTGGFGSTTTCDDTVMPDISYNPYTITCTSSGLSATTTIDNALAIDKQNLE